MYNTYEAMYDSRIDAHRWQDTEVDGITKTQKVQLYVGRKCRYSSSGQVSIRAPAHPLQTAINCFAGWRRISGRLTGMCLTRR